MTTITITFGDILAMAMLFVVGFLLGRALKEYKRI